MKGITVISVWAITLVISAWAARAEVLNIFPTAFKQQQWETLAGGGQMVAQSPAQLDLKSYVESGYRGWVQLKIPAGKTITRVVLYRRNTGTGITSLYLNRVKVGKMPEQIGILSVSSTSWVITSHDLALLANADKVIRDGYMYYLDLLLTGEGICHGAKVFYE